jgi:hypothetical protein
MFLCACFLLSQIRYARKFGENADHAANDQRG